MVEEKQTGSTVHIDFGINNQFLYYRLYFRERKRHFHGGREHRAPFEKEHTSEQNILREREPKYEMCVTEGRKGGHSGRNHCGPT